MKTALVFIILFGSYDVEELPNDFVLPSDLQYECYAISCMYELDDSTRRDSVWYCSKNHKEAIKAIRERAALYQNTPFLEEMDSISNEYLHTQIKLIGEVTNTVYDLRNVTSWQRNEIDRTIEECRKISLFYECLRYAKNSRQGFVFGGEVQGRHSLHQAINMIGKDNFFSHRFPEPTQLLPRITLKR